MIQKLAIEEIQNQLKDGLKECKLPPMAFHIIKHTLEKMGYFLSDSERVMDDMIDTNGWECDYYLYIWKDDEYTGYALQGSYYYGDHKIELNEV